MGGSKVTAATIAEPFEELFAGSALERRLTAPSVVLPAMGLSNESRTADADVSSSKKRAAACSASGFMDARGAVPSFGAVRPLLAV